MTPPPVEAVSAVGRQLTQPPFALQTRALVELIVDAASMPSPEGPPRASIAASLRASFQKVTAPTLTAAVPLFSSENSRAVEPSAYRSSSACAAAPACGEPFKKRPI